MLKNTYQIQEHNQKYWKIKNNIKKQNKKGQQADEEDQMLTYQDASDDEDALNEMMGNGDGKDDEYGLESGEDDYDEEIEQIHIKDISKRRKMGDDDFDEEDESMEEDGPPAKKSKDKKKKQQQEEYDNEADEDD